jgi:DNA-binding MarR family transcriptional regulator
VSRDPAIEALSDPSVADGFDPIAEAARHWSGRYGDGAVPAMHAVTSLMRAQQILMTRLNELLRPFELTFPRYEALMLLRFSRAGALPLGRIGTRLQVHPTSVTNTVDGLEKLGLVRREPSERDRRITLAVLTAEGRSRADRATRVLNDAAFGTHPLETDELDGLSILLDPLRQSEDRRAVTSR